MYQTESSSMWEKGSRCVFSFLTSCISVLSTTSWVTAWSVTVPLFPLIKNKKLYSCKDYDEDEERKLSDVWNMIVKYYKCYLSFFPSEMLS